MLQTQFIKIIGTIIAVPIQEHLVLEEIPQFGAYLEILRQKNLMLH